MESIQLRYKRLVLSLGAILSLFTGVAAFELLAVKGTGGGFIAFFIVFGMSALYASTLPPAPVPGAEEDVVAVLEDWPVGEFTE